MNIKKNKVNTLFLEAVDLENKTEKVNYKIPIQKLIKGMKKIIYLETIWTRGI